MIIFSDGTILRKIHYIFKCKSENVHANHQHLAIHLLKDYSLVVPRVLHVLITLLGNIDFAMFQVLRSPRNALYMFTTMLQGVQGIMYALQHVFNSGYFIRKPVHFRNRSKFDTFQKYVFSNIMRWVPKNHQIIKTPRK